MCWGKFQLAKLKFDRDGEGGRKALGMGNCRINIWDGSELELAWSKKCSSYFLFTLRVSSLQLPSNDASGETIDDKSSCQFSPEAEFTSPIYVHITLLTDTERE